MRHGVYICTRLLDSRMPAAEGDCKLAVDESCCTTPHRCKGLLRLLPTLDPGPPRARKLAVDERRNTAPHSVASLSGGPVYCNPDIERFARPSVANGCSSGSQLAPRFRCICRCISPRIECLALTSAPHGGG